MACFLIDADALITAMGLQSCKKYGNVGTNELADSYGQMPRYEIKAMIDAEPTIEAVEVIRCKDCRHYVPYDGHDMGDCLAWKISSEHPFIHLLVCEDGFCNRGKERT